MSRRPRAWDVATIDALEPVLTTLAPHARLVPADVVRRAIQIQRGLHGFARAVPRPFGYAWREGNGSHHILITLPTEAERARWIAHPRAPLRWLWQRLFELQIQLAWDDRLALDATTIPSLQTHIAALGRVALDEARAWLRAKDLLLPPRPDEGEDVATYIQFSAHWAGLAMFSPERLAAELPLLAERRDAIDAMIVSDLPIGTLLAGSRPDDSLQPIDGLDATSDPPPTRRITGPIDEDAVVRARRRGNLVRAAWLVARHAPDTPNADLDALARWLDAWLPDPGWATTLHIVLNQTTSTGSIAARLLYDLQKAALDHDRPPERLALVAWIRTRGRSPLRRRLDVLGLVRCVSHVRRALNRVAHIAFVARDRDVVRSQLERVAAHAEARLREALHVVIAGPIAAATASATRHVERVARDKIVAELLDRIATRGRIDFPTLRDAIARSHAKLADLRARDVITDPLVRADRALAAELDGVHRPAELYRRVLHTPSTLAFGTPIGRFLTRFVLLPFIGAYVILEGLQHTIMLLIEALTHAEATLVTWPSVLVTAACIALLVNVAAARSHAWSALRSVGRGLRFVFVTLPGRILQWRWLRRLGGTAATLVVIVLGPRLVDRLSVGLARARVAITHDLVPGLVRWILSVFRAITEAVERALYAVDERLRFRVGDRPPRIALRFVVALPWRVVSYVARFYLNVLLEPKYNPVKHFPVVTVGHKIILPMSVTLTEILREPLLSLGPAVATTIAATTVFLLPGFFGFLAWELKETWRIYAANRPTTLRPVIIGSHGEPMRRLLRPGFHSGTLPKIFRRIWRAAHRGRPLAEAARQDLLHHVAVDVRRFIARDVLALLPDRDVQPSTLALASNHIQVHLDGARSVLDFWIEDDALAGRCEPAPDGGLALALDGLWRMTGVDRLADGTRPAPITYNDWAAAWDALAQPAN